MKEKQQGMKFHVDNYWFFLDRESKVPLKICDNKIYSSA